MKDFKQLISTIRDAHTHLQSSAARAVNRALIIRNWLIGIYIDELEQHGNDRAKLGTLSPQLPDPEKLGSVSPQLNFKLLIPGDKIVEQHSYSHIEQLLGIGDQLKSTFYEIECIKGPWSIRELKRHY